MKKFIKSLIGVSTAVVMCSVTTFGVSAASFRNTFSVGTSGIVPGTVHFADSNFNDLGSNPTTNEDGYSEYNYATINGETGTLQHNGGSGQFIKKITETDGNKALQIAGKFITRIMNVNNLAEKHYRVDMSFKLTNCEANTAYTTILESAVSAGKDANATGKRLGAHIARNSSGYLTYKKINSEGDNTETITTKETISNDKWYNLSVEVDIPNKCQSIWINGRKIVEDVSLYIDDATAIPSSGESYYYGTTWHPVRILSGLNTYASTNKMLIVDDIKVYTEPEGFEKLIAEDFSGVEGKTVSGTKEAFYGETKELSGWTNFTVTNGELVGQSSNSSTWSAFVIGTNNAWNKDWKVTTGPAYATKIDFKITDASKDVGKVLQMRTSGNGNGFYATVSGNKISANGGKFFDIKSDTWYTVVMYADVRDVNYTTDTGGTGAVYLAERGQPLKCIAQNLTYEHQPNSDTDYGNLLNRPIETATHNTNVYYDNLVIYEDVRESDLANAAASFGNAASLATDNKTITIPTDATSGYTLGWTDKNGAVSGNQTAVFEGAEEKIVTYTATAADSNNVYAASREFDITVPAMYDLDLTVSGSEATANVTVNANNADSDAGYKNGWAVLALYQGGDLLRATCAKVTEGTAALTYDPMTTGSLTAKLFLWVDKTLKPLALKETNFTNSISD